MKEVDDLKEFLNKAHGEITIRVDGMVPHVERAWEQMLNVDPNPDLSDFLDNIEFLGENNGCNTT